MLSSRSAGSTKSPQVIGQDSVTGRKAECTVRYQTPAHGVGRFACIAGAYIDEASAHHRRAGRAHDSAQRRPASERNLVTDGEMLKFGENSRGARTIKIAEEAIEPVVAVRGRRADSRSACINHGQICSGRALTATAVVPEYV